MSTKTNTTPKKRSMPDASDGPATSAVAAQKAAPPPPPTIPLSTEARAAYQELYDKNELAIQSTADPGVLEGLNGAQTDVRNILTKDDMYRLEASTELYKALLDQIKSTNDQLSDLQKQVAAIAGDFAHAGEIVSAIAKVLKIIPAF